jgi:DNA (cytosine-5)-methyltransferase 1
MGSVDGMGALTELSLFTGCAGFTLGLRLAGVRVRTVCYVEVDPYRQEVIAARIRDGLLDDAPIWDDIRTFDGRPWRGLVDIVTAGFPCQPYSLAGKRGGSGDARNLWPDAMRVIREVGPCAVLVENVPGILAAGRGGGQPYAATVLGELAQAGYDAVWGSVSAAEVGAPHLRWRWWCLAWDAHSVRPEAPQAGLEEEGGEAAHAEREDQAEPQHDGEMGDAADPNGIRRLRRGGLPEAAGAPRELSAQGGHPWWSPEPPVCGVAYGVPHRMDRLGALGDSLVPAVVAEFLRSARSLSTKKGGWHGGTSRC